jgi:hypothetical protein
MTPKEKAEELVEKMSIDWDMCRGQNIQCALVAVDEIISTVNMCIPYLNEETYMKYWQEVKNEIEKI